MSVDNEQILTENIFTKNEAEHIRIVFDFLKDFKNEYLDYFLKNRKINSLNIILDIDKTKQENPKHLQNTVFIKAVAFDTDKNQIADPMLDISDRVQQNCLKLEKINGFLVSDNENLFYKIINIELEEDIESQFINELINKELLAKINLAKENILLRKDLDTKNNNLHIKKNKI